jgi:hypothetical protein
LIELAERFISITKARHAIERVTLSHRALAIGCSVMS